MDKQYFKNDIYKDKRLVSSLTQCQKRLIEYIHSLQKHIKMQDKKIKKLIKDNK